MKIIKQANVFVSTLQGNIYNYKTDSKKKKNQQNSKKQGWL